MTKEDIQLLYEYDRWANYRVLQAARFLGAGEFARDLSGSFRSVRNTVVHIIRGEWIWLTYWKEPPVSSAMLADLVARADVLFNPNLFPDVAALQPKWAEVEKEQIDFVKDVTNELLNQMLPFRATRVKLAHLMQHVVNHSTYHRGQVALLMRQLNAEPASTDFHAFLVEGRQQDLRGPV